VRAAPARLPPQLPRPCGRPRAAGTLDGSAAARLAGGASAAAARLEGSGAVRGQTEFSECVKRVL